MYRSLSEEVTRQVLCRLRQNEIPPHLSFYLPLLFLFEVRKEYEWVQMLLYLGIFHLRRKLFQLKTVLCRKFYLTTCHVKSFLDISCVF